MRTALLAALLSVAASAQPADPVEALADALALSEDQADLVAEVFDTRDPASLWTLAAELVPTLDADQREALFAQPARPDGAQQGARAGQRGPRGGARGDRPRDPARGAVARAARNAALGLSDAQAADLDATLDGMDRGDAFRALRDGEVPDAITAVLTEEQVDLYRAQLALQRHLRRAMRGSRGAR